MLVERVVVLMSTFNGEKHLRTQLDSVLGQTHQDLRLVIRDDGSTDRTREILGDYARRCANVQVTFGANIGVVRRVPEYSASIESAGETSKFRKLPDSKHHYGQHCGVQQSFVSKD